MYNEYELILMLSIRQSRYCGKFNVEQQLDQCGREAVHVHMFGDKLTSAIRNGSLEQAWKRLICRAS
jgi:ATP sulfurylase